MKCEKTLPAKWTRTGTVWSLVVPSSSVIPLLQFFTWWFSVQNFRMTHEGTSFNLYCHNMIGPKKTTRIGFIKIIAKQYIWMGWNWFWTRLHSNCDNNLNKKTQRYNIFRTIYLLGLKNFLDNRCNLFSGWKFSFYKTSELFSITKTNILDQNQ